MIVGLIGESPCDTSAISSLLERLFPNRITFVPLLDHLHGNLLDSQKTKRLLHKEYRNKRPDVVVFIRDLDGGWDNGELLKKRKKYFIEFRKVVGYSTNKQRPNRNCCYLLNVWELEALILSDVNYLNQRFNSHIPQIDDPTLVVKPKDYLKSYIKYEEADCEDLLSNVSLELICRVNYFNKFLSEFEKKIN